MKRIALALVAAPLVLTLAACGSGGNGDAASPSGETIAAIAPPAGKAWGDVITKTPDGGYLMGNPDAPIKVIEFASLTCSHCAEFTKAAGTELKDTFVGSGRVSLEFRNFVRDAIDLTAAQLTRCGAPESFFALTEQTLEYQPEIFRKAQSAGEAAYTAAMNQPDDQRAMAIAQLTGLVEFFAARGISQEQAATCLADTAGAQALAKATQDQGEKFGITGTPTFLINGEKTQINAWPELKARLEAMGVR
jgi:protein-disulfide isomerase